MLVTFMFRLPFYQLRPGFEFSFRVAVIFLLAIFLYQTVNIWLGLFLMLALFSHSVPMFYISGYKALNTPQSYSALNSVVYGSLFFTIMVLKNPRPSFILNVICIMASINLLWLIVSYVGWDPYKMLGATSTMHRATGIMANPNESSALMAISLPAFLRKKVIYFIWIPIAGLVLSKSFGGFLAATFAAMAYLYAAGHLKISMILALAVIGAVYWKTVDMPGTERFHPWSRSLKIYLQNNPVLGCGLGNWKLIYPEMVKAGVIDSGWIRLHSSFIQGWVEMGFGFLLFLVGTTIDTVKRVRPVLKSVALPLAGVVAVLGAMTVNSMFRMNALNAMIAVSWFALLEVSIRQHG